MLLKHLNCFYLTKELLDTDTNEQLIKDNLKYHMKFLESELLKTNYNIGTLDWINKKLGQLCSNDGEMIQSYNCTGPKSHGEVRTINRNQLITGANEPDATPKLINRKTTLSRHAQDCEFVDHNRKQNWS